MKVRTLNEIRKRGIEALAKALGPIGMVRFIQSFDLGKGDYTRERFQWLEQDMMKSLTKSRGRGRGQGQRGVNERRFKGFL